MADPPPYPGTPRWVKASGIVIGILLLLFVGMMVVGVEGHGPGRHISPGAASGGQTPPSSGAQELTPSGDGVAGHAPPERGH